jgi:hypothetical protein
MGLEQRTAPAGQQKDHQNHLRKSFFHSLSLMANLILFKTGLDNPAKAIEMKCGIFEGISVSG